MRSFIIFTLLTSQVNEAVFLGNLMALTYSRYFTLLMESEIHYSVNRSHQLDPILSQMEPI